MPLEHVLGLGGRTSASAAAAAASADVVGQRLAAPPHRRAQVVPHLGYQKQLLEHVDDVLVLLGGALDVAALPLQARRRLGELARHPPGKVRAFRVASRFHQVDLIADDDDGHPRVARFQDLKPRSEIAPSVRPWREVQFSSYLRYNSEG